MNTIIRDLEEFKDAPKDGTVIIGFTNIDYFKDDADTEVYLMRWDDEDDWVDSEDSSFGFKDKELKYFISLGIDSWWALKKYLLAPKIDEDSILNEKFTPLEFAPKDGRYIISFGLYDLDYPEVFLCKFKTVISSEGHEVSAWVNTEGYLVDDNLKISHYIDSGSYYKELFTDDDLSSEKTITIKKKLIELNL